jgi:hypothetical protein
MRACRRPEIRVVKAEIGFSLSICGGAESGCGVVVPAQTLGDMFEGERGFVCRVEQACFECLVR